MTSKSKYYKKKVTRVLLSANTFLYTLFDFFSNNILRRQEELIKNS